MSIPFVTAQREAIFHSDPPALLRVSTTMLPESPDSSTTTRAGRSVPDLGPEPGTELLRRIP